MVNRKLLLMTLRKLRLNKILSFVAVFVLGFLFGFFWPRSSDFQGLAKVIQVVDGDTIKVEMAGKIETVRFIGIDTPEIAHTSGEENECFGPEATQYIKNLLDQRQVYLIRDPSTSERGQYQRLLRYVFLEDGTLVNAKLIEEGYGFNYIYESFQFMKQFNYLENKARMAKKNLWSDQCHYYFE